MAVAESIFHVRKAMERAAIPIANRELKRVFPGAIIKWNDGNKRDRKLGIDAEVLVHGCLITIQGKAKFNPKYYREWVAVTLLSNIDSQHTKQDLRGDIYYSHAQWLMQLNFNESIDNFDGFKLINYADFMLAVLKHPVAEFLKLLSKKETKVLYPDEISRMRKSVLSSCGPFIRQTDNGSLLLRLPHEYVSENCRIIE
jgi:hypothetical protein